MAQTSSHPFELKVIPKGVDAEGRWLKLTLAVHASAFELRWKEHNLPGLIKKAAMQGRRIQVDVHAPGAQYRLHVRPVADVAGPCDPDLWNKIFEGASPEPQPKVRSTNSTDLHFPSEHAIGALHKFVTQTGHGVSAFRKSRGPADKSLRRLLPMASLLANSPARMLGAEASLQGEYRAVRQLFGGGGHDLAEVAEDLQRDKLPLRSDQTGDSDQVLNELLAGYAPAAAQTAASTARQARPSVLRALGIREKAGTDLLRDGLDLLRGTTTPEGPRTKSFVAAEGVIFQWAQSLLATAPYRSDPGKRRMPTNAEHGSSHDAEDQWSLQNRLAAIGQEFALHPFLGMAIDIEVDLSKLDLDAEAGWRAIKGGEAFLSATIGDVPASSARTAVDAAGHPRSRATAGQQYLFHEGWLGLVGARLANLEVHGSLTKSIGGMQQSVSRADPMTRGRGAYGLDAAYAPLRTGPLVLLHPELIRTFVRRSVAEAVATNEVYYLDDLVIGVRPDLKVSHRGKNWGWRPLLDREIVYGDLPPSRANMVSAANWRARREGFVPLVRGSDVGTEGEEKQAFSDQLFEWSGWNPAVPLPSRHLTERLEPRIKQTVRARRGNPVYRYGATVEVALRVVLQDGSSVATGGPPEVRGLAGRPEFELAFSRGMSLGGLLPKTVGPYRLQRYEPLRAPMVALTSDAAASPLAHLETADRIVLAASDHGGDVNRSRSCRYVMPGEIHDILELDRHGVFDSGVTPRDSGLVDFERTPKGGLPIIKMGERDQPVLRRRGGSVPPSSGHYYPDPLVKRLRLQLARRHSSGVLFSLNSERELLVYRHDVYRDRCRWPDARPLRVDFVTARPGETPGFRALPSFLSEAAVEILVPPGENFHVLVFPEGDGEELSSVHHAADLVDGDDSPLLYEMLEMQVTHLLQAPFVPRLLLTGSTKRSPQERVGVVKGKVSVHAGTTRIVELRARWKDPGDNPANGLLKHGQLPPITRDAGMFVADLSEKVRQAIDSAIDGGQPLDRPYQEVEFSVQHQLPDTRHRYVEYFVRVRGDKMLSDEPGARDSLEPTGVTWAATVRPDPPRFITAAPSFRFQRTRELGHSISVRECAISVCFGRDWGESSGPHELVGLVCSAPRWAARDPVCEWGTDPTRLTGVIRRRLMRREDFLESPHSVRLLSDAAHEAAGENGLVLYQPTYDAAENAWRVDLRVRVPKDVAQPFLRLVVMRFQPNAIEGAFTSPPVLLDYMQLPSERAAVVTAVPGSGGAQIRITVHGPLGAGQEEDGGRPLIEAKLLVAEVEGRGAGVWQDTDVSVVLQPLGEERTAIEWSADMDVPSHVRRRRVGIRISERTRYRTGPSDDATALGPLAYSDVMELRLVDVPGPGGLNTA